MVECRSTEEAVVLYNRCDKGDYKINNCYALYPSFVTPTVESAHKESVEEVLDIPTEGTLYLYV